ncbi:uncharacterized protein LOC144114694 isoform X5 [Amblyomma americanum]
MKNEYDLQLVGIVKDEPVFYSDSSKDGVFDANGSMKNEESEASIVGIGRDNQHTGSDAELTLDRATKQYREKCDAANLRTWSPNGLFPKLPSCVKPLLHGTPMSAERHKALLGRLRDEIIQFLKTRTLQSSIGHTARWVGPWLQGIPPWPGSMSGRALRVTACRRTAGALSCNVSVLSDGPRRGE